MEPLVSILIPAYNAESWISDTVQSAMAQTWLRKEIIVVDDGSKDRTANVARRFASKDISVVTVPNRGASNARNHAFRLSQGEYIQWLDADDLLAPDKIEKQLSVPGVMENRKILLSSAWAYFNYRTSKARFAPTSLYQDLTPVEWMFRKLSENLHMQTGTWLTSRELLQAAGPWDTRLMSDDDGEYYCRVLLVSDGTKFVPDAKVFYRVTSSSRWSHIGTSNKKKYAMLLSMKLHMQYIRSLENSDRVRKACLTYMQNWLENFYPERPDIVGELQAIAAELQGHLDIPRLRWRYAWMEPIFGRDAAKRAQMLLPLWKSSLLQSWDKLMYRMESRNRESGNAGH